MCGLIASFNYGPRRTGADPLALRRGCDAMLTRGPDGRGGWISQSAEVGLGHTRLAVIDLAPTGAQPMATPDGKLHVVFNGEIYNYRELRSSLERDGDQFVSSSDTEVLLHLYRRLGCRMVSRLRGMYAFALWDDERGGLLLARDPLGIKPLYYADDGNTIVAASQVKALLAAGAGGAAPSPAGHVGFFLWGHVPEPHTMFRDIRALAGGTTLWIERGGKPRASRPFDLGTYLAEKVANAEPQDARWRDRFADAVRESVRHHMVADVPVGVFLSSGIDSAAIAALAAECVSERVRTVTLGFDEYRGTAEDETPLAESMAREFGYAHTTHWVGRAEFAADFDRLVAAMDQPTVDGVNTYFVSKCAAQAGLKVALSGLGGDELLGGYSSFRDIPRLVRVAAPWKVFGRAFRTVSASAIARFASPKYAGVLELGGSYGSAYLLRRGLFMPWELPKLLDPDLVRDGWRELDILARLEQTVAPVASPRLRVSVLEMSWYMRNQLLRDADWASMAHSLELRVPLVDVGLLGEVARLVTSGNAPDKASLARVPRRALPTAILQRGKTGFGIPVARWLTRNGSPQTGLRGWATQLYEEFAAPRLAAA